MTSFRGLRVGVTKCPVSHNLYFQVRLPPHSKHVRYLCVNPALRYFANVYYYACL
jgi:hypothetical protein